MNKRQLILEHIKIAAYEGDERKAIRLYVENRISYKAFQEARQKGLNLRKY